MAQRDGGGRQSRDGKMKDIFSEIFDEIIESSGDLSRLYHTHEDKIVERESVKVAGMTDQKLIHHLSDLGQKKN